MGVYAVCAFDGRMPSLPDITCMRFVRLRRMCVRLYKFNDVCEFVDLLQTRAIQAENGTS